MKKRTSIFSKIFKKKEEIESNITYNKYGYSEVIYQNDHTVLVHDSCRICYNKVMEKSFEERIKYIEDKVKLKHTSILEHSNVIMRLSLTKEAYPELAEVLSISKYLNVKIVETEDRIEILIGGSIRGYRHIIENITNPKNIVYSVIRDNLYQLPSCYFVDMIEEGIFNKNLFNNFDIRVNIELNETTGEISSKSRNNGKKVRKDKYDIVGMDDIEEVYKLANRYEELFTIDDILDMVTISVLFKGVSRTASHQLVRHRAGITQLSQRYVNMKDSKFLSPEEFKPEKYDANTKYKINIDGIEKELTLKEIGKLELNIYEQLLEQGLLREDARSFLPSNIETSLYMTFTFRNFIKFLELRTGKGAQAEIKQLAEALKEDFELHQCKYIGEDIYSYLIPKYNRISMDLVTMGEANIDEVIAVEEELLPNEDLKLKTKEI